MPVRGARQRKVLALLLLNPNQPVSQERLATEVWPELSKEKADRALRASVQRLRARLVSAGSQRQRVQAIGASEGLYQLSVENDQLDLLRFEHLFSRANRAIRAGDPRSAAEALRRAISLWRGEVLEDLPEQFAAAERARLHELQSLALEAWAEAELLLGRHAEVLPELEGLVRRYPLRERFRAQLMLALFRSGRAGEALDEYQLAKRGMEAQFGIEPSPLLRELDVEIRRGGANLYLPTGDLAEPTSKRLTLLFTDIEGSTRLLSQLGDGFAAVLREQHLLLREAIDQQGGWIVDSQGDGLFAAFNRAEDAVNAAYRAQEALHANQWPTGIRVSVRMGLHSGMPLAAAGSYVGLDVHRAARIAAVAYGGQVIISDATQHELTAQGVSNFQLLDLGEHELKDMPARERLFQVVIAGLAQDFPPLRTGRPVHAPEDAARSILVVADAPADRLIELIEPLARSRHRHDLILVRLLQPEDVDTREDDLQHATDEVNTLRRGLTGRGVRARSAIFRTGARGDSIVRLASEQDVDLLVMQASVDQISNRDDVRTVLADAPADVAVVVSANVAPSQPASDRVLVPFGGSEHDWAAVELGAWMADVLESRLCLYAVAREDRSGGDASRLLASAALAAQQLLGVETEARIGPRGRQALLAEASAARLAVAGLGDGWLTKGAGQFRRGLAADASVPVILVRRGLRPSGVAPQEGVTRFTWSLSDSTLGSKHLDKRPPITSE